MFADSSLFVLASALRSLLAEGIDELDDADVLIGTPKQAKEIAEGAGQGPVHNLNMFFYRFEPEVVATTGSAGELHIRVHCLLTAFAGKSSEGDNKGTIGQNDLRLLGEAMRVLHQHPRLLLSTAEGRAAAIQIVPVGLSLDELNNIWSMVGSEVGYRPSVGYELALVPIPLERAPDRTPKTARVDVEVRAGAQARRWSSTLAIVRPGGLVHALSVPLAERPEQLELQIGGREGELVILRWRVLADASEGWLEGPSSEPLAIMLSAVQVPLPLVGVGQALVWVEPIDEQGSASAPVLVTLFDAGGGS